MKIFVFSRSHPIFFLPVLQTESMPIVSLYILIFNSQASGIIQYVYHSLSRSKNWRFLGLITHLVFSSELNHSLGHLVFV